MKEKVHCNSFIFLKLFPRSNGISPYVDDGHKMRLMEDDVHCPKCKIRLIETVSLEFCGTCGYVETDYWGLVPFGKETLEETE